MIQLIVSDIDATLIDRTGALPPRNVSALKAAAARGTQIALATVRKLEATLPIVALLDVPCTLICQGGATIYDQHQRLRHISTIPIDLARELAALADAHGLALMTTIDEINYAAPGARPPPLLKVTVIDVACSLDALTHPPTRFIVRGAAGVELLMAAFARAPLRFVRHYLPDGTLYDAAITSAAATKESALAWLCAESGITPGAVLAIGDSESDIGMLRMAGIGVAVGDAHPHVRAAADWVAPPAAAGGLAAAVERFVLHTP